MDRAIASPVVYTGVYCGSLQQPTIGSLGGLVNGPSYGDPQWVLTESGTGSVVNYTLSLRRSAN
eukprot:2970231-Lingulodinium_polyedra.AAC.1